MKIFKPVYIFPLMVMALITGISGGWIRLGFMGMPLPGTAGSHGLLMVGGFLGTLISLERSMVMKNKVWLTVPLMSGVSVPFVIGGWSTVGISMVLLASMGLVAIMYFQTLRHQLPQDYVMALGAVTWMLGNFTYMYTGFMAMATGWWMAFLLFTILGERLELSKFLPTPQWAKKTLFWLIGFFFMGLLIPFHGWGSSILGTTLILMALWLLHYDMARIASRKADQFKYIGVGLRTGYIWLALNGAVLVLMEHHAFYYDLYLHTFFLGFVFSMIWAHAPVILPMVLHLKLTPYHPILWLGWLVFQLSLAGRVVSSFMEEYAYRQLFGVINGWSILGMFALMAIVSFIKYWHISFKKKTGPQPKQMSRL
ncbi:hypothetical protein [Negadavirga shengliensis]|uniref:NnrS protein n=1 Tax=Negadavirga shengliensis TaxID=1389218 RepID=A0ABV9SYW0_9BACT